jgi:DNA-binding LacI/PurR family transcriptional regulator/signal transduction histidine kinase
LDILESEGPEPMIKTKGAPVFGFLAARFDEAYQNSVWLGARREAEKLGAAIVFYGGQRIGSPIGFEALDNIAFSLAEQSRLAALIVMSNVIGTYISNEELEEFLGRFDSSPVVSIGIELKRIPSVRIEASGGMRSIAEHLVRSHGRRNFLFLAGPRGHPESESREEEFLRSIAALAPSAGVVHVIHSVFQEEDAYDKVSRFFDSGIEVDAVVAANDLMAIGAMRALAERGIDVPRDVSVTGFDDTEDSRFTLPPLTTVRQPTTELGRLAVRLAAARIGLVDEEPAPARPEVTFVVRESCGCPYAPDAADSPDRDEEPKSERGTNTDPLVSLSEEVNRDIRAGRNPASLRRRIFEPEIRERALLTIAEGESRFMARQRREAEKREAVLRGIESSLVASFGIEDILRGIAHGARELGISACWLSLFESKGMSHEWSKLVLAADAGSTRILAPYGLRFRTAELIPGGLPGRFSAYVCEPLRFGDDRLGYIICTDDSKDRRLYEAFRDQVSSALKGAMLMAAERDHEKELERTVRSRTLELSYANARLKDEMAGRRQLERELLSVSNSIMSRIGQDIHDHLCQDIAGIGLMAAILEGGLRRSGNDAAADSAAAIAKAAGETAALAKGIARGLYPAELEGKGIVAAVESLVQSSRERCSAILKLEAMKDFTVKDSEKALHIYRIVQEALNNAVKHSLAKEIRIGLYMDRKSITVEVSDDGIGIPSEIEGNGGMGLQILKYRASVIGGELRIRTRERGTVVSCRVPR